MVAEAVTWPEGSLGCPQPGENYRPAPTPGYQVVFEVAGATCDCRLTAAGFLRLCPAPTGAAG